MFGKTLRHSQQTYQQAEYNAIYASDISKNKLKKIEGDEEEPPPVSISFLDYGFFTSNSDPAKDYFMLVNRYYSNWDDFNINLYNLNGFSNWSVMNYIDTTFATIVADANDEAEFNTDIDIGDAGFYSVLPVVKYGGELTVNDTISSDVTLYEEMTINNNVELIVEDDYTITAAVTLTGTGFITGDGYVYLTGNGTIDINSWDRALFKSRSGDYPKLIWFEYPSGAITVTGYKIYSDYGGWHLLAAVSDTVYNYTDTTVTINPPEGQAGTDVQYKVTATYSKHSETSASNIIEYNVPGGDIEKRNSGAGELPIEYSLGQNYPNPFNPSTTINYSSKYDGLVVLKIYDILGKEVKTLVDEKKEAGNYSVEFDASALPSGVYIYQLNSGKFIDVKKMILLK